MPGKLVVMRGLPASGKTTLAKAMTQAAIGNGTTVINLDRDMFRLAAGFGVASTGDFEEVVTKQQRAIMREAFSKGWTVIESSTNLRMQHIKDMRKFAYQHDAGFSVVDVPATVDECIARDLKRGREGGHSVGADVIRSMHAKFLTKGFPKIQPLEEIPAAERYVPNTKLPKAILVDIDGTVAKNTHRSPYDYTKVFTDEPNQWVINLVMNAWLDNIIVIFVSGREDSCRLDTERWIRKHIPITFKLFMRKANDDRMDAIIKLEIFDKEIRNNFNVLRCYDDRRQVIDAYRAIDLNVLDVAGHNF